ncbi:MAG: gamma-glutamyl-gamma-aminobutyrate hydrolase family protein [Solirubrobacterales bacterium]|nr:gamma-glutamyl-gamma-aminobutyrate hydrolase family protein [Solirubrobacterales bacterium]
MSRPKIGICTSLERARFGAWDEPAALTPYSYVLAVQRAGGMAILLPPDAHDEAEPDELLDLLDGLILAGGVDVDPALYGQEADPHTVGTVPERDRAEIALARRALERDLPLLGICRGMQVMNVALGGTLIQHLPDVVGNDEHRRNVGTFEGNEHPVRLAPGSLAAQAAGEERHSTRSHHHQAIDELGAGLQVTGWSDIDDLPEAVEIPDRRFALGVQWHPEADETSRVVATFVAEAAAAAAARV